MTSHTKNSETICALATPAAAGAVGIVRLSGPRAQALLQRACPGLRAGPRRLVAATVVDPESGLEVDRVLVCVMVGPRSYTGEDVVEVHGHGGVLNMERLLGLFLRLGARQAEPGEFTRRAFVNGRVDLTQAEAVARVITARSERALRNAQALLAGALGEEVSAARARAVRLAGDLEACIDFADEIGATPATERLLDEHRQLARQIEKLAASYETGRRLAGGVSVALMGPVNGGKSSLFNALVGRRRALVSEEPGTTRDFLEEQLDWDGLGVTLIDTAGEAEQMSDLERAGRALAAERVARSDLTLWVVDLAAGPSWTRPADSSRTLIVGNKSDLLPRDEVERRLAMLGKLGDTVGTSARSGAGLGALRRGALARLLPPDEGGETVRVTERRQWERLRRAADAVVAGARALRDGVPPELVVEHTREALAELGKITGESYGEEVLDSIFARFCVGK